MMLLLCRAQGFGEHSLQQRNVTSGRTWMIIKRLHDELRVVYEVQVEFRLQERKIAANSNTTSLLGGYLDGIH